MLCHSSGEGDQLPGVTPGDVIFVVQEKDHSTFQRRGADLIMKKNITLLESLTGVCFEVKHLDGHRVIIKSEEGQVIPNESVRQVEDEGMPVYGNSHLKGCLFVQFEVKFPESLDLSRGQLLALQGILPGPAEPVPKMPTGAEGEEYVAVKPLTEVDTDARRMREQISKSAYDSDEEGGGGGMGGGAQRVQCAQQ